MHIQKALRGVETLKELAEYAEDEMKELKRNQAREARQPTQIVTPTMHYTQPDNRQNTRPRTGPNGRVVNVETDNEAHFNNWCSRCRRIGHIWRTCRAQAYCGYCNREGQHSNADHRQHRMSDRNFEDNSRSARHAAVPPLGAVPPLLPQSEGNKPRENEQNDEA